MLDTQQTGVHLYVTFVEKEGPFLKIWGQTDKNNSVYVEQFLLGAGPQFDMGIAKLLPEHIQLNGLVCAKYKDSKYYRARILNNSFLREGFVEVCFLDYGNKDVVPIDNIRSLQSFPTSFISIPPLATGFIFAEAHCVGGGEWNDTIFESIVKEIKYREVHCQLLSPATQYYLIKIIIDSSDLCSVLIQRGLMQPISLQAQQAVLLSMSMQRQQQTTSIPQMSSPNNLTSGGGLNTYKASSLEPGCLYPVYVSYVNDGPCHFSVQLKTSEEVLVKLMNEINSINLRILEDVPMPGTICLARCQEDGNICRAVVTNEVDNQFKVFYVDFGNYEVVPLDSLYQIPFKYVLPKVMAIRLSLGGVEKSTVTLEMQRTFKQFVDNRLLHMKVTPSSQRMAIPKCELWDPETKTSALDVVNRAARHAYPEPISLTRGFSQQVKVSYVYSCNRFYVQLSSKETELANLMSDLAEICQSNETMDPNVLKPGLPCCALFESDNQWYRSEVVQVLGENVVVRYIDYGNEEPIANTQLKNIDGEHLTVLRPQAIECCLNGYQNMEDDTERDQLLEELILEGQFTMKVVDMLNKKALVDLYDLTNCNVASLLLDKLAMAKSQVSPALVVQAGNKIEHKKSFGQQNGPSRGGEIFRFDRQDRGERQDRGNRFGRGDRGGERGREKRDFNKPENENWRQESNKEFRKYDKNSNENGQDSWRQNNKGFSPKHNRFNKEPEADSWETNNTSPNNNDNWNQRSGGGDAWDNAVSTITAPVSNEDNWTTPAADRGNSNFGGRNNRDGGRPYDRGDRGGRDGERRDRFGGKPRDGGFGNKSDTRSENSYDGSEKGFHNKGPRTSSRNDYGNNKFQKNYDKPRNFNNSYQSSTDDSWNVSAVSSPLDSAPVTATYGSCQVVGTEANVTISWFHNPSHFYLQLVDSQSEFKRLMEDIQLFYKSRKPEPVNVVGAPVIGLFPEDNVLYRAQILEVLGTQYKIYYVDFGNVSTVTKVWPIEKKFINLPAQALVCSLRDVAPPGEAGSWLDADSFGHYFDKENFVCRFIDEDEIKTYVNLFYNSEDIGELLVRDGLAVSTKSSIPPVEIPLLLGQQFRAIVKSVNNLADIILALECGSVVCCAMHNIETAAETHEDTLKGMLEQTVIVYVDNVIDDKLEITLYDIEGNKIVIVDPDEGAFDVIEPLCPILVLRSVFSGYVSFANDTFVYIQPSEYLDLVSYLLDQLFEMYDAKEKEETNIIPEEEQIYAVHSEDANWYRGKVVNFDDETVTVLYIDYGNTESIKFDALRELAPQFKVICSLCLKVNIGAEALPYTDKEVTAKIFYGDEGWEGTVYVAEHATTSDVPSSIDTGLANSENAPTDPVESTNEVVTKIEDADAAPDSAPQEVNYVSLLNQPNETQVFMSHIDSPNEFYLQLYDSFNDIENLQVTLQEKISEMPILETPSAGMLCAAPFSIDQQWYRAEILDADDDITTVRFIDFGNTDVIDNATTQIKTLTPDLLTLAVYATKCSLLVTSVEDEWSKDALDYFEELTKGTLMADFLNQDGKLSYVELYVEDREVSELLVEQGYAINVDDQDDDSTKGKLTGFVSHLNSPSEFWIQLENCIDDLEWIAEQLSTAENFTELEDLTPGTLCAALFPEDQMWYRARILSNTVAGIELLFIDYGNSCTGSSLRQLPEDLLMSQPLAMKCSLQKPEGVSTWSEQTTTRFSELSAEGQTIFTIKKLSTGETSVVQLFLNDEDIVPKLFQNDVIPTTGNADVIPSTEEGYVLEDENLARLQIAVDGESKPDNYELKTVNGKPWDNAASEKFKEINKEGKTLYQIEFLDNKTVRLYLEGQDIGILLRSIQNVTESHENLESSEVDQKDQIEKIENKKIFEPLEAEKNERIEKEECVEDSLENKEGIKSEEQDSISTESHKKIELDDKSPTKKVQIEDTVKTEEPISTESHKNIDIDDKSLIEKLVIQTGDLTFTEEIKIKEESAVKKSEADDVGESVIQDTLHCKPKDISGEIESQLSPKHSNEFDLTEDNKITDHETESFVKADENKNIYLSDISAELLKKESNTKSEHLRVSEDPKVPTNTPIESPTKEKTQDNISVLEDKINSLRGIDTIPEDVPQHTQIDSDSVTNVVQNVSPKSSQKTSPIVSREHSRPSSRNSRRYSHDDKVLPGYLSRPESPHLELESKNSGETESKECADAEILSLLETVVDKVSETRNVEGHSRPHSRLSHDERIVPGVVSRPASPVKSDQNEL